MERLKKQTGELHSDIGQKGVLDKTILFTFIENYEKFLERGAQTIYVTTLR